jgi:hypothetical protein
MLTWLEYRAHVGARQFLEHFHRRVAKAQNASLGRWENFWPDKISAVLLVSDSVVLEKMAYAVANRTVASLVRSAARVARRHLARLRRAA